MFHWGKYLKKNRDQVLDNFVPDLDNFVIAPLYYFCLMRKILWHSELINKTGFSKVSRSLVKQLKKDYDITVLDWQKQFDKEDPLNPIDIDGFKLLGKLTDKDEYGSLTMQAIDLNQYDCIFILNDVWNINELCKLLKYRKYEGKVVCYFPVDAKVHDPDWYSDFDIVTAPVTYTDFARNEILKAYPDCEDTLQIIPHGIDTDIFYPFTASKQAIRENLFGTSKFNNSFIVLNANRNQPRKRLDITMEGFSIFAENKEDVFLYMHCNNIDHSMDIKKLGKRFNITDKLIVSEKAGLNGVSDKDMNLIYNACDVGIQTSLGEGWGLTNTEMAAVGKPQLVPKHSACEELFADTMDEFMFECAGNFTLDNIMTVGQLVKVDSVARKLEKLFYLKQEAGNSYAEISDSVLKKFTSPMFHWQNIADKWRAILSR